MGFVEMGQGAYTGEAMLLAEELGIGLDQLEVEHAPANEPLYRNPLLMQQATGGSTTVRAGWSVLRTAGATARNMLVGAAADQWKVPPDACAVERGVIHHKPTGRALTFGDVAAAAARRPVPDKVLLKAAADFTLIGQPFRRVDSDSKVNGSAVFGIDFQIPNMKVAVANVAPVPGARIVSIDDARTRTLPGVREIVRLPHLAAVIGDHFWAAKTGAEALQIEWDLGENASFSTERMFEQMAERSRQADTIIARQVGTVATAGSTIEAMYELPNLSHAPMEPLNAVVHVSDGRCEVWTGTQVAQRCADVAAEAAGVPRGDVVVHNTYLGGGFGRRLEADVVADAAAIARHLPYPVKLIRTREQEMAQEIPRPAYYDRISATLDAAGRPVQWHHRVTGASVARRWIPAALRKDGLDLDTVEGAAEPPYKLPNLLVEWCPYELPAGMAVGWWRGVGATHNLFTVECFIDELAQAAGMDPVAYRRALLDNERVRKVLDKAAESFGWTQAGPDRPLGRGVAVGAPFGSYVCAMVEVEVDGAEVRMRRAVAAVDCGTVVNPNSVEAQIQGGLIYGLSAALHEQLTYRNGRVEQGNFDDYPVMRMYETPQVAVHILRNDEPPGGIGEVGTAIAAPALVNAVSAAVGRRIRRLPISSVLTASPDRRASRVN